ncbi:uncharacterized protein LOC110692848 [Chenopodium quinoa]|uniref:uncharacterized protein LOC110692848 n=1 Tax=Chenopodium quinoa TaxID=63459 RepID=UPI000B76E367|nr:uncharacterized protein LOC110692848 [Chenopodium quinoa]
MKEFATTREREAILKEERIKIEKDKEQRKREELDIHKMRTMFDMLQTLKNSPTPLTPEEESYKIFLLAAIRMLAYGMAADAVDEYVRISQSTARVALQRMIGSIDCMHWEWKNCPTAWKAQYAVFDEVLHGRAPPVNFTVNGHEYNMAYYLADDIYPKWATFVQGITFPQLAKDKMFADHQAAARKDVERAFGVLQARFAIIRKPSLAYDEDILRDIMKACIIMHNMIVEDERHNYTRAEILRVFYEEDEQELTPASTSTTPPFEFNVGRPTDFDFNAFLQQKASLRDREIHLSLKRDLVEHIWLQYRPRN